MRITTMMMILAVSAWSSSAMAANDTLTGSRTGDFKMGQKMVSCAAFFDFAAEISTSLGRPASVENFQNLARGWHLAGTFLLTSGRAGQPALTADSIRSVRLTALKARYEAQGETAFTELTDEHRRDCEPLSRTQEAIIAALRQAPGQGK